MVCGVQLIIGVKMGLILRTILHLLDGCSSEFPTHMFNELRQLL